MAMCNGGDHDLRAARDPIDDQSRVIVGLRNMLRHRRVPWSLVPSITTAAIIGTDAPGLKRLELDL